MPAARSFSISASRSLSSRRTVVRRSWYSLICASIVSDFCAPEVDLFLGELLGAGFGDLELLLELRHLDALGFGDLLEMAGLLLPALALGFDALEPMGQDVELLLETSFRRAFALQLLVELGSASFRFAERIL